MRDTHRGGSGTGLTRDINVTSMIDVLLVLLVVVLLIVPRSAYQQVIDGASRSMAAVLGVAPREAH